MTVFNAVSFDDHEQVVFCNDSVSGLKAIIAIHNTACGPAAGGCRMWPYASDEAALEDALRLSRGMSYKNAMAGLPLGGGKSVIIANAKTDKNEALLASFGQFVESLSGRYITAEDVGVSVEDMEIVASQTRYVAGLATGASASGDPSPFTAHGVFVGLQAAVKYRLGRSDLKGIRVAVQGLGHVGYHLCQKLHAAGARLVVADISDIAVARAVAEFGADIMAPERIHAADAAVFAPCAMGAAINDVTIPELKAVVVAGSANNQLAEDRHGEILRRKGILYAPDYVINAGGIINVAGEVTGDYRRAAVAAKIEAIGDTLESIFLISQKDNVATGTVADSMAREKLAAARDKQKSGQGLPADLKRSAG